MTAVRWSLELLWPGAANWSKPVYFTSKDALDRVLAGIRRTNRMQHAPRRILLRTHGCLAPRTKAATRSAHGV